MPILPIQVFESRFNLRDGSKVLLNLDSVQPGLQSTELLTGFQSRILGERVAIHQGKVACLIDRQCRKRFAYCGGSISIQ